MLILTQSEENVFVLSNIAYLGISADGSTSKWKIRAVSGSGNYANGHDLGNYLDKARAVEVLKDICEFFESANPGENVVYRMPAR